MKLGICLRDLGPNQLSFYAVNHVNRLIAKTNDDFVLFFEELVKPTVEPMTASMSVAEIWRFGEGHLVATDIDSACYLANARVPARKWYYVWDLEWMRGKQDYVYNLQAFRNEEVGLIARSSDHAKAIANFCNKPVKFLIEDCDVPKMLEKLGEFDAN